jgi:hypothetical protein
MLILMSLSFLERGEVLMLRSDFENLTSDSAKRTNANYKSPQRGGRIATSA